jgi:hypothetical protein
VLELPDEADTPIVVGESGVASWILESLSGLTSEGATGSEGAGAISEVAAPFPVAGASTGIFNTIFFE